MWSSHVAALSMAGKAWNSATVTACLVLAFLFIGLVSQSAHAHKPLFADGQGMSPGTALLVPDPTVSHVLYAELPADSPSFWFTFDAPRPGRIPIQLAVPDGTPGEEMELAVVLPSHARHAFHQVQQPFSHRFRGSYGDEQAVHCADLCFRGRSV